MLLKHLFSTKEAQETGKHVDPIVTMYCLVCGKRSAGRQSEKLPILLRGEIWIPLASRSVQLEHPLHPSLRHSIISKLFSFHRRDAISSIACTRSISLCTTRSSSVSTRPVAVWVRYVSASALLLAQPFSASASRKRNAADSDLLASSSARISVSSRWLCSLASAAQDAFCRAL
ncbi:hypothetical protein F5888DRAFT_116089 [Russula emetica]|nr:hypothetical protein F5888DRAFT_116089 [Russula emetica]